jgi:hypothetical protein
MKFICTSVFIILFSVNAHGQNIISIKEGTRIVDLKYSIVDINSTLEISIQRDSLLKHLGRNTASNAKLVEKLDRLNFILESQIAILAILESKVKSTNETKDLETLGEYSELMVEFYDRLNKDPELRARVVELYREYNSQKAILDQTLYPSPQAYALKNLGGMQTEILATLRNSDEIKQVRVKLVAFLNTSDEQGRRVHVENFDQYAAGEFYELQRWVTTFSEQDISKFEQSKKLAGQLNKLVVTNTKGLESFIRTNLTSPDCFSNLLTAYQTAFNNRETIFNADKQMAEQFLTASQTELQKVFAILLRIKEFKPGEESNLLVEFNGLQTELIDAANELPTRITALAQPLPAQLRTVQTIVDLKAQTDNCMKLLQADVDKVKEVLQFATNLLAPFRKSAIDAEEIGDEVLSFSINDIPQKGSIDLRTTGKRKSNDSVIIKLLSFTKKDSIDHTPGTYIQRIPLKLEQIGVHLVPHVSVILAYPFNKTAEVAIDNKFQFAPSGSFLFKFGARKSNAWNFISPGIGFNMSTPDFDLDGTPDVAVGGVMTLLQDVLSVGLSYNTKTDSPMWFFGLSLPFGALGFPVTGNARKD